MQNPFVGRVTSEFGMRNGRMHAGMDIAPKVAGTVGGAVFAAFAGTVVKIATDQVAGDTSSGRAPGRTGNGAVVVNPDGEKQVYNHMMPVVRKGDAVAEGQLLGHLDRSGQQTGPHLHFETWGADGSPRNPRIDFSAKGVTPGVGSPSGRTFLPLRIDGAFAHRTVTELERALAKAGLYRGIIEEDHGRPAVAGPVLFTAYQRLLAARGFDVGPADGTFGARSVKAEQSWLHKIGFFPFTPPDGERGKKTIEALQRALNAGAVRVG
jgi:murein DD-endopeptidase MepM/ murein hydrolase activator NlpD